MRKISVKYCTLLLAALLVAAMLPTYALAATSSPPDETSPRILNIYKYAPSTNPGDHGDGTVDPDAATGRTPLANVEFEIYRVPAGTTTDATPTDAQITNITTADPSNLVATIKTNEQGLATYSFGTGREKDGVYLIVEKTNAAVEKPADPFYLNMPLTDPEGDDWLYTVTVYPKNDLVVGPTVDKDVNAPGTDEATADIGDTVTWIIRGGVPDDLYQEGTDNTAIYAKSYTFTDTLDPRLDYKENLSVKLYNKSGTEITLGTAYYTTTGTTATVDNAGGTVKVALTPAGMKFIQENLGTDTVTPEIRVYFDTAINDTAELATGIPNNVTLDYTNSSEHKYEGAKVPEADVPEVATGGLVIDKVKMGAAATKLAGATFKIAREATQAEIADAAITTETLYIGNEQKTVVFVNFYKTAAIEGDKVYEVTTNDKGEAIINGLQYGTYYLVETKAPADYNQLTAPMEVTINGTSHVAVNAIKVENSAKFVLPVTGGSGTLMFTAGGVLLIGIAVLLLVSIRKKKAGSK